MNNLYLVDEFGKQRQSEYLQEAAQARLMNEVRKGYSQEHQRKLTFAGQVVVLVQEQVCKLSAWVNRTTETPGIASQNEALRGVCKGLMSRQAGIFLSGEVSSRR